MRARITEAACIGESLAGNFHEHMQNNHEVPITIVRSCFRKATPNAAFLTKGTKRSSKYSFRENCERKNSIVENIYIY